MHVTKNIQMAFNRTGYIIPEKADVIRARLLFIPRKQTRANPQNHRWSDRVPRNRISRIRGWRTGKPHRRHIRRHHRNWRIARLPDSQWSHRSRSERSPRLRLQWNSIRHTLPRSLPRRRRSRTHRHPSLRRFR